MTHRVYVLAFLVVLVSAVLAQAQTFTTLYYFTGLADGGAFFAGVIKDSAGNLYGTTDVGGDLNCGDYGCGTVYKLDPAGTETVLHSFVGAPSDGAAPSPVARDGAGNIYGTTPDSYGTGYGTIFRIDNAGNETVLYNFSGGSDGCYPYQGLIRDKAGNLYGTTQQCGTSDSGTIFKVDSAGDFSVLHSFTGSDGSGPSEGHLTMDTAGNIYGVTYAGGSKGDGVLYELSKSGTLTVLHNFVGGTSDGCGPSGSVVRDKAGNLYGTTVDYVCNRFGTIWKVNKKGKEIILHKFTHRLSDGCHPWAGVTLDSKGNLYGVTDRCGAYRYGALYELSAKGRFTLLHSFDNSDGANPDGEVLWTSKGTLFGTTLYGGTYGSGTVWSYVP